MLDIKGLLDHLFEELGVDAAVFRVFGAEDVAEFVGGAAVGFTDTAAKEFSEQR